MPRPADTLVRAQALATLPKAAGFSAPFARDHNRNQWTYADMGVREALLDCVRDILTGRWYQHIDPMPGNTLGEALVMPGQLRLQYLDHWLNTLCTTYKDEPTRRIMRDGEPLDEDDPLVVAINEAYDQMAVNVAMQQADKFAMAYGNVVQRVFWDEDFERWVLHQYTSQNVRVVENDNNPAMPWATVLCGMVLESNPDGRSASKPVAEIWMQPTGSEAGAFMRVSPGVASKVEPIATERPPLVHIFNAPPTNQTRYHIEGPGVALAQLNVAINEDYLCRLGYTTLMQAHGQLVLTNPGQQANIQIGPGRAITLTGDPETLPRAEFINPGADLATFIEVIRAVMHEIQAVHGIPAQELDVQTDSSGAAIVQAKAPLAERRQARMKMFREPERQLLRAVIDMGKTHGVEGFEGAGDPADYDVSVKFGDTQTSVSVADKIALEKHDLSLGLVTRGELLMRRYPDRFASVAEADKWLAENAAKLEADKAMGEPEKPEGFGGKEEKSDDAETGPESESEGDEEESKD